MIPSLSETPYEKVVVDLTGDAFSSLTASADLFICAAGFEPRAGRAPLVASVTKNPLVVAFEDGPSDNDKTFKKFANKFGAIPGYDVCILDLGRLERFENEFEEQLRKVRNLEEGPIIIDISALPNFAICIVVGKVRQVFRTKRVVLLYTEAEEYFPREKHFEQIKRAAGQRAGGFFPAYLSQTAANMFFPSMFTGMALGHNDTCLIVFPGYEPHRTTCVVEATNPTKLVMVFGEPGREDLKWRLELSQIMHKGIDRQLVATEELSSTSEISDNLRLLLRYYDYLYDDHIISVCPINSKMQAVAATLAWEIYPDIQLNFPVPVKYLAKRFSVDARDTFAINLGVSPLGRRFTG
jgi:hypothetical protein